MFASAQKLENVCVIVDYNKWQATARSNETLMLAPLRDKWAAFGWDAREIDGHDILLVNVLPLDSTGEKRLLALLHQRCQRNTRGNPPDNAGPLPLR